MLVVKAGFCAEGNHEQKQAKKKSSGKKVSKSFASYAYKEPTGELALFKTLLEVRGNKSQVSGETLVGFDIRWFSHILSKGAYPSFRLFDRNIVLKTAREHELWETQRHKLKELPEWKWVFEREQELKELYYKK
jgi:hypothetical protein